MRDLPSRARAIVSPDHSPIFVIGTGRSGTTLLRQMLNAHPRIHLTHEAGFYSYARHAPARLSASEWLDLYFQTFSFAWLGIDPEAVRAELPSRLPRAKIADAFRAIMRVKARSQGKARYGEKNPLDTHNLSSIFADYEDPRVVYIVRDPRPTVQSFNRMPFATPSAFLNTWMCRVQFDHVRPFLDRILEVRLEDLTKDPRTVMQGILRFVGESWDDAVLDHVARSATDDVPPLPWFTGAVREKPSNEIGAGAWRDSMDPAWVRIIERTNRDCMSHYGYPIAPLSKEPGLFGIAWAFLRDIPAMAESAFRLLSFKRKLDRHFQSRAPLTPEQGMRENLNLNPSAWRHYPGFQLPPLPSRKPSLEESRGT